MVNRQESGNEDARAIDADLAARLAVLRREHPELRLGTELLRVDERAIVVRAEIVLPSGATASGLAGEPATQADAYERAESRAVARALLFLGLGVPALVRTDPSPRDEAPAPAEPPRETPSASTERRSAERPVTPATDRPAPSARAAEPARPEPPPEPTPIRPSATSTPAAEPDPPMEDFSWTAFWNWARKLGYQNKPAVEAVIGQSITSLNPAQVRNLLREKAGLDDQ